MRPVTRRGDLFSSLAFKLALPNLILNGRMKVKISYQGKNWAGNFSVCNVMKVVPLFGKSFIV